MSVLNFVVEHFSDIVSAAMGVLTAVIGIALLIPGEQPEKALQSVVDFLSKFSKKSDSK